MTKARISGVHDRHGLNAIMTTTYSP